MTESTNETDIVWLKKSLGSIETKLDALGNSFSDWKTNVCGDKHLKLETRITALEVRMYIVCAVLMAAISAAFKWL